MEDYDRTREWLNKNGFEKLKLVCRDRKKYSDKLVDQATYKADQVHELGITTFYESDLKQALIIAEKNPIANIIWWGKYKKIRVFATGCEDR